MSFLNPNFLWLLPLALFPLFSLFYKGKPKRSRIVSWLLLVKDEEINRKYRLRRDLLVFLRILILSSILIYLARPLPKKYKFDFLFLEKSPYTTKKSSEVGRVYRALRSYYGERVRFYPGNSPDLEGKRIFIFTTFFSVPQGINSSDRVCYDTLPISNMGISWVGFSRGMDTLYLVLANYSRSDSTYQIFIFIDTLPPDRKSVVVKKGEKGSFAYNLKVPFKRLRLLVEPLDDVTEDNALEFDGSLALEKYALLGESKILDLFFGGFLEKVDREEADVVIAINQIPLLSNRNKICLIFSSNPQLVRSLGVEGVKELRDLKINGFKFPRVLALGNKNVNSLESLQKNTYKELDFEGKKIFVFGFVPDPEDNDFVYIPDFWSHLLKIIRVKPIVKYTAEIEKIGKTQGDTLFLMRPPIEPVLKGELIRVWQWMGIGEILRWIKLIKFVFLALWLALLPLEIWLSRKFMV